MSSSSSGVEPPQFQEASRCDVCKCSFNTFRSTIAVLVAGLCAMNTQQTKWHYLNMGFIQMSECALTALTTVPDLGKTRPQVPPILLVRQQMICLGWVLTLTLVPSLEQPWRAPCKLLQIASVKCLYVYAKLHSQIQLPRCSTVKKLVPSVSITMFQCLVLLLQVKKVDIPAAQSNPRPRKATSVQRTTESVSKNVASSSSKPSTFFNAGLATRGNMDQAHPEYEGNGEGLREAIKNSDAKAVKKLLDQGVDPNYCDKQGLSLLHLAAVFNQTEIVFILMEHGASLECRNAQGETPLDCAPTMLQYKMREKIEEMSSRDVSVPSSG